MTVEAGLDSRWRRIWVRYRILRYLSVGAINTVLSYLVFCLAVWAGAAIWLAGVVSLLSGMLLGFVGHGTMVFGGLSLPALRRFVFFWLAMYVVYVVAVESLVRWGASPYLAGAIATAVNVVVSYVFLRDRVFKQET